MEDDVRDHTGGGSIFSNTAGLNAAEKKRAARRKRRQQVIQKDGGGNDAEDDDESGEGGEEMTIKARRRRNWRFSNSQLEIEDTGEENLIIGFYRYTRQPVEVPLKEVMSEEQKVLDMVSEQMNMHLDKQKTYWQKMYEAVFGKTDHKKSAVVKDTHTAEALSRCDRFVDEPHFTPYCHWGDPYIRTSPSMYQGMWILTRRQLQWLQYECGFVANQTRIVERRYAA